MLILDDLHKIDGSFLLTDFKESFPTRIDNIMMILPVKEQLSMGLRSVEWAQRAVTEPIEKTESRPFFLFNFTAAWKFDWFGISILPKFGYDSCRPIAVFTSWNF